MPKTYDQYWILVGFFFIFLYLFFPPCGSKIVKSLHLTGIHEIQIAKRKHDTICQLTIFLNGARGKSGITIRPSVDSFSPFGVFSMHGTV